MRPRRGRLAACALLVAAPLFFAGCAEAPGRLLVMRAGFMHARGMSAEAISLYMQALGHPGAVPYAEYGLGVVFMSLGEDAAALARFAAAAEALDALPEAPHRELRHRNHYNMGMVLFAKGDFAGAAASFRDALRVIPGRIEAMRNLELSLMSMEREDATGAGLGGEGGMDEAMSVTFERIRQMEVERWRGQEWPEEERAPGDDR